MGIIKGKKLMAFIKNSNNNYVSIGYCTNHTLSTSASTVDVAHKDLADVTGGGRWADEDIDVLNWTITAEAFYANDAEGISFATLWGFYAAGTEIELKFAVAADSTTGVPTGGWTAPATGDILSGKAIITAIDMNAPVSDNSSFSITFTGKGALSIA